MLPNQSVQNGSDHATENGHKHGKVACTDQDEHRARASASDGPAHAEDRATEQVALPTHGVPENVKGFAFDGLPALDLGYFEENRAQHNRRSYHPIHVEGLEIEHFINPVPTDDFPLRKGNPEEHSNQNKSPHGVSVCEKGNEKRKDKMRDGEAAREKADDGNE